MDIEPLAEVFIISNFSRVRTLRTTCNGWPGTWFCTPPRFDAASIVEYLHGMCDSVTFKRGVDAL